MPGSGYPATSWLEKGNATYIKLAWAAINSSGDRFSDGELPKEGDMGATQQLLVITIAAKDGN